jgi:hypothetical protein
VNRLVACAVLFCLLPAGGSALAQAFPSKPIRVEDEVERWTKVVERGGMKPE